MRNRALNATDPTGHRDLALDQGGGGGVDIRLPLLSKGEAEKALKNIGQTAVTTASFIPGVGDAVDVYDFMAALSRGEYGEAGFVLAAAALPGSARAARNVGGEIVERIARNLDELPDGHGIRLNRSLASQQQMGELGEPFAGVPGTPAFRDAPRVANTYGGQPSDWAKMTSNTYTGVDGFRFQTHWVENMQTGLRVEFKTKLLGWKAQ